MLHLRPSSREGHVTVFLDIGSASIGASIVTKDEFLWSTRVEYGYQSVDDFERYVRTMYATLLEVGMKAKSEGLVQVKRQLPHLSMEHAQIYCVYGSPWVFNTVEVEEKKTDKTFQVTNKLCEKMREDCYKRVLEGKQAKLWQEVMGTGHAIESHTDMIRVRGYIVDEVAFGKQTNELSLQNYFSVVPEAIEEHVEEVIEKLFPNNEIYYTSSTRTLASAIKNIGVLDTTESNRILFAEVTGEMTSVSLLKNGRIADTGAISFGINHLLRSIVPKAANAKEARGAAEVQIKTKKDITQLSDLPEIFHNPMNEWRTKAFEAIKEITGGVTPPSKILVSTDIFWEKVYTTALGSPYTIPGTHDEMELHAVGVSKVLQEEQSRDQKRSNICKDARLCMYHKSV